MMLMSTPRAIGKVMLLTFSAVMAVTTPTRTDSPTFAPPALLTVMTCNLRVASPNPPNAWPERRPLVLEVIHAISPEEIGT